MFDPSLHPTIHQVLWQVKMREARQAFERCRDLDTKPEPARPPLRIRNTERPLGPILNI